MSDDQTFWDDIEGYCSRLSCLPGSNLGLHVSTKASSYDVTVERWGAERTTVWAASGLQGTFTPPPLDADANGCEWPASVEIPVGADWQSGFYLVTLIAHGTPDDRATAHAGFVVRSHGPNAADTETADPPRMLLVLATNTWNAYNTWGGKSLYTGGNEVSFRRPFARGMLSRPDPTVDERDDRKSRPTHRGEEPDADGLIFQKYRTDNAYPSAIGSTGWYTHERRFVEWAERAGYTFDYAVSSDLDDANALDGYSTVLSVGHDEYWSEPARTTIEEHVRRGGNFASFSGNTMFWQVRLEPSEHHEPSPEQQQDEQARMVCHKYTALETDPIAATEPAAATGLWSDPVTDRPETDFLGAGSAWGLYHRFGQATPRAAGAFTVYRHDHWMLAGTGLLYGDLLGADDGVVGYETVGCRLTFNEFQMPIPAPHWMPGSVPTDIDIVAFAPSSNLGVGEYPKSIAALSDQGDLEFMAQRLFGDTSADSLAKMRYGNSVMLVCRPFSNEPASGEVAIVGTTDWVFGLARDSAVQRVTANVLDRHLS